MSFYNFCVECGYRGDERIYVTVDTADYAAGAPINIWKGHGAWCENCTDKIDIAAIVKERK